MSGKERWMPVDERWAPGNERLMSGEERLMPGKEGWVPGDERLVPAKVPEGPPRPPEVPVTSTGSLGTGTERHPPYPSDLVALQRRQSIWQLSALVLPPLLHGLMWSAWIPS